MKKAPFVVWVAPACLSPIREDPGVVAGRVQRSAMIPGLTWLLPECKLFLVELFHHCLRRRFISNFKDKFGDPKRALLLALSTFKRQLGIRLPLARKEAL